MKNLPINEKLVSKITWCLRKRVSAHVTFGYANEFMLFVSCEDRQDGESIREAAIRISRSADRAVPSHGFVAATF